MKKLSSRYPLFFNNLIVFGIIAICFIMLKDFYFMIAEPSLYIGTIFFILLIVYGMKKMGDDLADEVFDLGDSLKIRKGKAELIVPLSQIMKIRYEAMRKPSLVTIILSSNTVLGDQINFFAASPFFSLKINRDIEDLIIRVDKQH